MLRCVIMIIALFAIKGSESAQCHHGEVRLVDGCTCMPKFNEGRVEICYCTSMICRWGTVCDDYWDNVDAQVVCRQLGYRADGAQAFHEAHFGQGYYYHIALDNVECDGSETTLLQCSHNGLLRHDCSHYEDAGVRCSKEERWLNISVDIIDNVNVHTVLITWMLPNSTLHWPGSYVVECFSENEGHRVEMSASNTTFSVQLMGLIPDTSYNCCVLALSALHTYTRACTDEIITIQPHEMTKHSERASNLIIIIGGVLGFIIAILFILFIVAILCSLSMRSRFSKTTIIPKSRSSQSVNKNLVEVPVNRNVSYVTTTLAGHPTIRGPQSVTATDQSGTGAAAEYSRIGPSYETIHLRRQQPNAVAAVSARISERYEFSEAYLAVAERDDSGGIQNEASC